MLAFAFNQNCMDENGQRCISKQHKHYIANVVHINYYWGWASERARTKLTPNSSSLSLSLSVAHIQFSLLSHSRQIESNKNHKSIFMQLEKIMILIVETWWVMTYIHACINDQANVHILHEHHGFIICKHTN